MGGMALGVPGVAAKPHNDDGWRKTKGRDVNQILEEPEVRTLLDELGNPPLQRGRGQKTTVDVGASRITRIAVPSHVGTLLSSKSDNGINETFFVFGTPTKKNGRVPPGFLKRLPPEYRDLPAAGEGVLRVGPNGEPILFGADGASAEEAFGQETLMDNKEVRIVKSTYQGETGLIREFKRGPKKGTIQATEPLSDAELSSVESEMSRVRAQDISASDVSTANIEIPNNFFDVVERYDLFVESLGECDVSTEALEGYTHKYAGAAFELSAAANAFSKFALTAAVKYLVATAAASVVSGGAAAVISFGIAGIVAVLLALNVGRNYTVGIHDNDLDYYFGKAPLLTAGVANQYRAELSELVYGGTLPTHLDPDLVPQPI